MKRGVVFLCMMLVILGISTAARATLYDRGGGLIYDDVLDITWLQDANYAATELTDARVTEIITAVGTVDGHSLRPLEFKKVGDTYTGVMTWWAALAWVDQLVYQGYEDWRLPQTLPVNGTSYDYAWSYDGSTDNGWNISAPDSAYPYSTSSEMAYMYYVNLGNLGSCDITGGFQPGWGLINTSYFDNLQPDSYWSGTEYAPASIYMWIFIFSRGDQRYSYKGSLALYAWAIRPGDSIPIPEPSTLLLLSFSLLGLAVFSRKFRKS